MLVLINAKGRKTTIDPDEVDHYSRAGEVIQGRPKREEHARPQAPAGVMPLKAVMP